MKYHDFLIIAVIVILGLGITMVGIEYFGLQIDKMMLSHIVNFMFAVIIISFFIIVIEKIDKADPGKVNLNLKRIKK